MKILSFGNNSKLGKDNIFVFLWESFNSLNFFVRAYILTGIFIVASTPFIINNSQRYKQYAQSAVTITANALNGGRFYSASSETSTAKTSSVSIGANKLALIYVAQRFGDGGVPTLSDPNRNWQQVSNVKAAGKSRRLTLFRSMKSSTTTGTITITSPGNAGGPNSIEWSVVEHSNVNTSGTNGSGAIAQSATRTYIDAGGSESLSGTITLSSSSLTNSAVVAGFIVDDDALPLSPGSGYVLTGSPNCSGMCTQAEFRSSFSKTANMSWANKSTWIGLAAEIK